MARTPTRTAGAPGRPKDLAKRMAILRAATLLFLQDGFDRVSMDQVAAAAGVSKLTVYSHFGDKDGLFVEAVRAHCEHGMPAKLFEPRPNVPLRRLLTDIGIAFQAMVMTPQAIAGFRILCSPQSVDRGLPQLAWIAGHKRVQEAFAALLERRVAAGELQITDPALAASQFFTLLKGDCHARAVLGIAGEVPAPAPRTQVKAAVELFLLAYGPR